MAVERIRTLSAIAEMLWATKGIPRVLQQPSITMLWLHTFDFVQGRDLRGTSQRLHGACAEGRRASIRITGLFCNCIRPRSDLCVGGYRPESNARLEHGAEANTAFSRPAVRVTALQLHRGWPIGTAGS